MVSLFFYAGIGSRQTPKDIQQIETNLATILESKGGKLRSGRARGSDEAFERGVKNENNKEIFTPNVNIPRIAFEVAATFHPVYYKLPPYNKLLMARNSQIILGEMCNDPVKCVICWTPNGEIVGGTGQGLRIAQFYHIPIYNLYFITHLHRLLNLIEEIL